MGADDYVAKPFSPRELMARIRAVMRRSEVARARGEAVLRLGTLTLDPGRHEVRLGDDTVELTPREFDLLEYLMRNRSPVLSRQRILDAVWGRTRVRRPRRPWPRSHLLRSSAPR